MSTQQTDATTRVVRWSTPSIDDCVTTSVGDWTDAAGTTPSDTSRQGTLWEMADSDRNAMDGDSVNESGRTRVFTLEIEALKLKLELEKMRSSRASSEEPEMRNRHTVSDQLTTSASVLLTPEDYECLRHCCEELMSDLNEYEKGMSCIAQEMAPEQYLSLREQERVSLCSNPSANTVQRTLEELPRSEHQVTDTSLEDEGEEEQDAQVLEPKATNSMSAMVVPVKCCHFWDLLKFDERL
ncbi:hypothetical protein HPB50_023675 [Hyalomma asiaticum]|uniref:Uncharacterized protein n=1 Tax=Hyalomma asiaticum TaxID=266040 RepID=A0ACB7T797_HYAAI|nr:hypothetical protein HPB50_023675 [Hyalomma asiaticum]